MSSETAETDRSPRVRRRAIAVVLGVVVALAMAEVLARVAFPGYAPRTADYTIAPLDGEPPTWVYAPNSTVRFE